MNRPGVAVRAATGGAPTRNWKSAGSSSAARSASLSIGDCSLSCVAVAADLDRYPPNALPFAQMHLARGMNHVLAALEEAQERVAAALPSLSSQKRAG